jgi:hypothetical protein
LEELPARVDALTLQISQLRDEMGVEFSAVRAEMASGFSDVRAEIHVGDEETRRVLGREIRTGLADVKAQALMLYEAQQAAWKLLDEQRRGNRDNE